MAAPQNSSAAVAGSGSSAPDGSGPSFGAGPCHWGLEPVDDGSCGPDTIDLRGTPEKSETPGRVIGAVPGKGVMPGNGGGPHPNGSPEGVPTGNGPVVLPAARPPAGGTGCIQPKPGPGGGSGIVVKSIGQTLGIGGGTVTSAKNGNRNPGRPDPP